MAIIEKKIHCSFYLHNKCYIYCRLAYLGERDTFSTGIRIDRKHWHRGSVKGNSPELEEIRDRLIEIKYRISKIKPRPGWTVKTISSVIRGADVDMNYPMTLRKMLQHHNQSKKKLGVKKATSNLYRSMYNAVDAWLDYRTIEDIYIAELDRQHARDFYHYSTNVKQCTKEVALAYMNYVNTAIRFCIEEFPNCKVYPAVSPWLNAVRVPKQASTKKRSHDNHLTQKDLDVIWNTSISGFSDRKKVSYAWMKWTALFQAYTGFSFKDLGSPFWEVEHTVYGELIHLQRGKTAVSAYIPMTHKIKQILENLRSFKGDRLFPFRQFVIDEDMNMDAEAYRQDYDQYRIFLQNVLGPAVGMEIKSHTLRHTFGMMAFNDWNIPVEDVSAMMGHSSVKQTMDAYVRVEKRRVMQHLERMKDFGKEEGESKQRFIS